MTTDVGTANLAASCALVDGLASHGVRHAVICPGSRSTPLAVALVSHPTVRVWVLVDERSAGYFALGMARQLEAPVALLCTSGTAAANFYPAVAEASLARIPLIVLTADRPPELRGWGAAQTIDQIRLYGEHVKWSVDMPVPSCDEAAIRFLGAAASRAAATAAQPPAGPVHLNFPFREPLLPVDLAPSTKFCPQFDPARLEQHQTASGAGATEPKPIAVAAAAAAIAGSPRGIIVCGPSERVGIGMAASALSAAAGYPLLADPLSGVRFGRHDRTLVIDAYDAFLRHQDVAHELRPDIVIRTGAVPTSKTLQRFLAESAATQHILVDPGEPRDPDHLATTHLRADVTETLGLLSAGLDSRRNAPEVAWSGRWTAIDQASATAIASALDSNDEPFEGRALAEIGSALPACATLVVGNSMPVRDADAFVRGDHRELRIVANRGANGIDGVVSSALGAAAVARGPVVLAVGDLSFHHDLNGLLAARLHAIDATVVVLNNNGGGIFSFLPQAAQLNYATFEALLGTPIGLDVASAARLYGASYARPANWRAFRFAVCEGMASSGFSVIEMVTDREKNVQQHQAVWDAVRFALRQPATVGA